MDKTHFYIKKSKRKIVLNVHGVLARGDVGVMGKSALSRD